MPPLGSGSSGNSAPPVRPGVQVRRSRCRSVNSPVSDSALLLSVALRARNHRHESVDRQPPAVGDLGSPGLVRNSATAKRRASPDTPIASGRSSGRPNPCAPAPRHPFHASFSPPCRSGTRRIALHRAHAGDRQVDLHRRPLPCLRQPDLRVAVIDLAADAEKGQAVLVKAPPAPREEIVVLADQHVDRRRLQPHVEQPHAQSRRGERGLLGRVGTAACRRSRPRSARWCGSARSPAPPGARRPASC